MLGKWGKLLFCHNLCWKAPLFIAVEAAQQCGGKNELHQVHLSHQLPLLCSTKMKKGGKQMAKQINYTKKNHVTCQIYTLFFVAVFLSFFFFPPTAHIFEIEFWKPYTLLTPFMLHQFSQVDSYFFPLPSSSVSMGQNLINTAFVHGVDAPD